MGYQLRRWLADRLPDGISSGERLVALEVADQANDQTRRAYGRETLATLIRRTGYANTHQLGKVLGKLGANGVELRVPVRDKQGRIVVDSRKRTVYACNGHELNFYVPLVEECPALKVTPAGDQAPSGRSPAGVTKEPEGPPPGHEGPPPGEERSPAWSLKVPQAGGPSPQSPQEISSSLLSPTGRADVTDPTPGEREDQQREEEPQPPADVPTMPGVPADLAERVMKKSTATAEEFARIIADARRDGVRRPGPWLLSDHGAADFRQRLEDLRAGVGAGPSVPVPPPVDEYRAAVRAACEHGTPGGSGRCPLCRVSRPAPPTPEVPRPRSDGSADRFIAELRARLGGGAGEPSPSRVE